MLSTNSSSSHEMLDPSNILLKFCTKNPGHEKFIPVEELKLKDLPRAIRSQSIIDYIMAHEKLVVRVMVEKQSLERPYGSSCQQNHAVRHSVSGYTWCSGEKSEFPCPLEGRSEKALPHTVHSGIVVYTPHHAVFDEYEARHSKVRFFHNNCMTPINVEAVGYGVRDRSAIKDLVGLQVFFHDDNLYDQVSSFHSKAWRAWKAVPQPYKEAFKSRAVVISHPHGGIKKVTIGDLLVLEEEEEVEVISKTVGGDDSNGQIGTRFPAQTVKQLRKVTKYNAATCSGSSGAPVLTGYYHDPERPFMHSSTSTNSLNINFSVSY